MPDVDEGMSNPGADGIKPPAPVLVWDTATRLFHWGLVAGVAIAWVSGGTGHIVHEIFGCIVAGLIAFRVLWGVAGTRHALFSDFVKPPRAIWNYIIDIARNRASRHLGHNPAGGLMILALLSGLAVIVVSGLLMLTNAFFGVSWIENLHAWTARGLLLVIPLHILGVVLASRLHRENLVAAMLTGWKSAGTSVHPDGGTGELFRRELLMRVRGNEGLILLMAFALGGAASGWQLTSGRISRPAQEASAEISTSASRTLALSTAADEADAALERHSLKQQIEQLKDALGAQGAELKRLAALIQTQPQAAPAAAATASIGRPAAAAAADPARPATGTCERADVENPLTAALRFARDDIHLGANHYDSLDRLLVVAAACPNMHIKITGYSDKTGKRTQAALDYLAHRGVPLPRLHTNPRGSRPSASGTKSKKGNGNSPLVEIAAVFP